MISNPKVQRINTSLVISNHSKKHCGSPKLYLLTNMVTPVLASNLGLSHVDLLTNVGQPRRYC